MHGTRRYAAPLSLSGSVLSHRGDTMAAAAAAMQLQRGRRSRAGGKLQLNSRGVASVGLQLRADRPEWWGLAGLTPLLVLGWDALRAAAARVRGGGSAGSADGGAVEEGEHGLNGAADGSSQAQQRQHVA
jgi:hypothetical protein